jgi:hypothetical protein
LPPVPGLAAGRDASAPPPVDSGAPDDGDGCARLIDGLVADEELAAAMEPYYREVPRTILSAKIVSALYLRVPRRSGNPQAAAIRAGLAEVTRTEKAVRRIIDRNAVDRALLRDVFLREGYLFEEDPEIAAACVRTLSLTDLFERDEIFLLRGGRVERLVKDEGAYVNEAGERVSLLLNDRVAETSRELEVPSHLDLDQLRADTGALRIRAITVGGAAAAVRLIYPDGFETDALIEPDGLGTRIVCASEGARAMDAAAERARGFWRWNEAVAAAAAAMVAERPGFDEPTDEPEGDQEDGKLRSEWRKAYQRWESRFWYREEEYRVFDRHGNPTPPQVCIDFVFDTWERAAGSWFRKRGARPGRTPGFLDFATVRGLVRRHTPSVLEFATSNPGVFERHDFPCADWIPFKRRAEFAHAVARNADAIREGDLLVIHGLREEDLEDHYHTALVLRTDPLSGMPMVVADNAGRPRIRNLASAMRSAPRRSIKHRLRLDQEWLDSCRESFLSGRSAGEDSRYPDAAPR